MTHGLCELLWIKSILKDLGNKYSKPKNLYYDNKASIEIVQNLVQHDRTKHVEVDRNFIKERLDKKIIKFSYVRSENQLADILTKAVSKKLPHNMIDNLGMRDIYSPQGECWQGKLLS